MPLKNEHCAMAPRHKNVKFACELGFGGVFKMQDSVVGYMFFKGSVVLYSICSECVNVRDLIREIMKMMKGEKWSIVV